MGLTRTLDNEKTSRRQSWISSSPLFNTLFSYSPPTSGVHRSHSMNERATQPSPLTIRQHSLVIDKSSPSASTNNKKVSTLATILHKAKHRRHGRSVTMDATVVNEPELHVQVHLLENDDNEADKSQLKNDFMNLAFTEEFRSTVNFERLEQGRILDIGCGSGAWCIEMAQKYPHLEVVGLDYKEDWMMTETDTPTNCHLFHGNILDNLTTRFAQHSFDFIHIRLMALVLTLKQYKVVVSRYGWDLLKPGGTMELLEVDLHLCSAGPVTRKMNQDLIQAADHLGFQVNLATRLASVAPGDDERLNLQQRYQSLPIGLWGGRLGVLFRDDLVDTIRRCQASMCQYTSGGDTFVSDLGTACREMEQYHTFANFHFLTVNKRPIM
ncbi:hypothetical protein BC941DRAFT_443037 [Chlamydoabsidia padenii]|nr:hypothetical protein BC941DRAFT_443037 [Chlamydoabsidia padenii]